MKTCFVGLSHLGLVSSICWGSLDQDIIGIDIDKKQIINLNKKKINVHEPLLKEKLKKLKNIKFTNNFQYISECNTVIISKDLDIKGKNKNKYQNLFILIKKTLRYIKPQTTLIIMSQVEIGFCRRVKNYIKKKQKIEH